MKSIERRFHKISQDNPSWGSFICFTETIRGQHFSYDTIRKWFNKLVENNNYDEHDKRAILRGLSELTEGSKKD